ncbi:MAG: hypothetical protein ACRCWQ_11355 [Bacilli bacterium]
MVEIIMDLFGLIWFLLWSNPNTLWLGLLIPIVCVHVAYRKQKTTEVIRNVWYVLGTICIIIFAWIAKFDFNNGRELLFLFLGLIFFDVLLISKTKITSILGVNIESNNPVERFNKELVKTKSRLDTLQQFYARFNIMLRSIVYSSIVVVVEDLEWFVGEYQQSYKSVQDYNVVRIKKLEDFTHYGLELTERDFENLYSDTLYQDENQLVLPYSHELCAEGEILCLVICMDDKLLSADIHNFQMLLLMFRSFEILK